MPKKDKVKLFKEQKAALIFGDWWDNCLLRLSPDAENGGAENKDVVIKMLMELLKFSTDLTEVIKTKVDLGKAKERMKVDLVGQLEATKAVVDPIKTAEMDAVKARLLLAQQHFKNAYEVEIVARTKSSIEGGQQAAAASADVNSTAPASQANSSAPQDDNAALNSSSHSEVDRHKAASEKRMEMLREKNKKRAGVGLASPAQPPRPSTNNGGSMSNSNVMGGSNRDDGRGRGDNARQPPGSGAATAAVSNAQASTRSSASEPANNIAMDDGSKEGWGRHIALDDGSKEGWGRRAPRDSPPMSDFQQILLHRDKTDTRQWGPLRRQIPPYPEAREQQQRADPQMNRSQPNFEPPRNRANDSRGGHDSQLNHQPASFTPRDQPRDHGYNNDSRQSYTSNSRDQERDYRSIDSRDNRQPYDSNPSGPPYDSSRSAPYDSQSSRHPYPNRTDSSDNQPYTHGGNIRNNQPVGGNTGTGYRDEYRSNDASQFVSRTEDGSRRGSEYDRRDSRVSSYSNRSSDRPGDDRREFEERWRNDSRPSSYRSDSPPRENRGPPRTYDDDRRRDEDRFDDRKRRDRDDSGRGGGGGSRSLCKYFFTPRGCRNGSGCRFSHEEGDDRKPSSDRSNERGGRGRDRVFEDGGSEDGEVRPVKRFRGPDRDNIQFNAGNSSAQPPAAGAGRGRGRGAHINKPAWMTQGENGSVPVGASSVAHASAPINTLSGGVAMNNADLADLLSSVTASAPTISVGRGRGNVDNRPAWMTAGETGPSGATSVSAPPPVNDMNGRFAPPPAAHLSNAPPQQTMGRGRGRGVANKPAWMDQAEWDRRNA
jgi:hypothetical protein